MLSAMTRNPLLPSVMDVLMASGVVVAVLVVAAVIVTVIIVSRRRRNGPQIDDRPRPPRGRSRPR